MPLGRSGHKELLRATGSVLLDVLLRMLTCTGVESLWSGGSHALSLVSKSGFLTGQLEKPGGGGTRQVLVPSGLLIHPRSHPVLAPWQSAPVRLSHLSIAELQKVPGPFCKLALLFLLRSAPHRKSGRWDIVFHKRPCCTPPPADLTINKTKRGHSKYLPRTTTKSLLQDDFLPPPSPGSHWQPLNCSFGG